MSGVNSARQRLTGLTLPAGHPSLIKAAQAEKAKAAAAELAPVVDKAPEPSGDAKQPVVDQVTNTEAATVSVPANAKQAASQRSADSATE